MNSGTWRPLVLCILVLLAVITASCNILQPTTTKPPATSKTTKPPTVTTATTAPPTTTPVATYSHPRTYYGTRTVTIRNENAAFKKIRIWLPVATEWESQRNVVTGAPDPVTGTYWQDETYGTRGLFLEVQDPPKAGGSLKITEEFSFTGYEINYNINPEQVQPYDTGDTQYGLYTQSQYFIESDDPAIARTAAEIKGDETNPYRIARRYYDWVMTHMTYQKVGGLKGAQFAYENGYGECGDYSCLFIALCRAGGIPARPVVGRWATSIKADWHIWAEFYLPGYGWIPADATVEDDSGGNYFGHLDNQRLIFNKQCDVTLSPAPTYFPGVCAILQTWFWEYDGQTGTASVDVDYTIAPVESN
jgi:transglutaminase-like putative cysteine protease